MSKKRKIIFWVSIVIAAACIGYLVYYFVGQAQRGNVYDNLQEEAIVPEGDGEIAKPEAPEQVEIPIDFASLQAQYPDLYAWIEIPGTNVAYPIMQSSSDNAYYLNYTIDGVNGLPGSIYTEYYNTKDFTDFDTVIYGHNMLDDSMFGGLDNYHDINYLNEHRQIIIYTPTNIRTYQIFAAVTYDDRHILMDFNFQDAEQRQAYINSITSLASDTNHVLNDVTVTPDSKLITLSTCTDDPTSRYLIEAVLVDEK